MMKPSSAATFVATSAAVVALQLARQWRASRCCHSITTTTTSAAAAAAAAVVAGSPATATAAAAAASATLRAPQQLKHGMHVCVYLGTCTACEAANGSHRLRGKQASSSEALRTLQTVDVLQQALDSGSHIVQPLCQHELM